MGEEELLVDLGVAQVAASIWECASTSAQIRLVSCASRGRNRARVSIQASHTLHNLGSAMKLKITIDGKTYEVEVEAAEPESPAARRTMCAASISARRRCAFRPRRPGRAAGRQQAGE